MFTSGRDNFPSDQGPTKEVIHASATQLTPTSLGHLSISSQKGPSSDFCHCLWDKSEVWYWNTSRKIAKRNSGLCHVRPLHGLVKTLFNSVCGLSRLAGGTSLAVRVIHQSTTFEAANIIKAIDTSSRQRRGFLSWSSEALHGTSWHSQTDSYNRP